MSHRLVSTWSCSALRRWVLLCTALVVWLSAVPAEAKVFLTVDEALQLAYPGCAVTRQTVYLTAAQRSEVEQLAGGPLPSSVAYPYRALCQGKPAGTVWFDAHRVRTMPETMLIAVDPAGRVQRIEVLSFNEPEDYLPRSAWYAQFIGKSLTADLALKGNIRPVSGATLSARAATEAVRRALALQKVLPQ